MPKVRVRDNLRLDARQYRIKVADIPVAEGKLYPGMLLAIDHGTTGGTIAGLATRDPAGNRPATWIEPALKQQAESLGFQVLDPVTALISHLAEVVRRHADELLSRDAAKHLIDQIKLSSPAVVDELIPQQLRLAEVQQVLQLLLREQISIRPLAQILEALGEQAARTRDPWMLTEHVRRRLARAISARYRDKEHRLLAVTLEPAWEDRLRAATQWTPEGAQAILPPAEVEGVCRELAEAFELPVLAGLTPVVLASAAVRPALRHLVAHRLPRAAVLSYDELTADTLVESAAMVGATAVNV
jgi:flagellar biosynthesis protein FlhA